MGFLLLTIIVQLWRLDKPKEMLHLPNSAFKGSGNDGRVIDDGELSRPLN
jgi:hypothetical protein